MASQVSRKYVRGQVTKLFNGKDTFANKTSIERSALESKLLLYKEKLEVLNKTVLDSLWDASKDEAEYCKELDVCEAYFDRISACLAVLKMLEKQLHSDLTETAKSLLKNPIVPLPKFNSGDEENVEKFLSDFELTIAPYCYPDRDKLLLLKQQVSGRATVLLQSLEANKQTYADAKGLLVKALASQSLQKYKAIQQLTLLKLDYGVDPFAYVGQMSNLSETVSSLRLKADDFLQYFFWAGLNDTFKAQLTNITNHVRPDLNEIRDNFFEASERYLEVTKKCKITKDKKSVNLALNVDYESNNSDGQAKSIIKRCFLCDDMDHLAPKCTKYCDPLAKLKRLEELNGCIKCGSTKHTRDKCTFKFYKRCYLCHEWHFAFLCTKVKKVGGESSVKGKSNVSGKSSQDLKAGNRSSSKETASELMVVTKALHFTDNASVLPTFNCKLVNGSTLRGLKDCGCQSSFITEDAVSRNKLKVIDDDVSLVVNGFNSSKKFKSKLVEVTCHFGSEIHCVEALSVPTIDISLNVPGLSDVAYQFVHRGFVLADDKLLDKSDIITGIDLILGTNAAHCLMDKTVRFGSSVPSVYLESSVGVMLLGCIDSMKNNMSFLDGVGSASPCNSSGIDNYYLKSIGLPIISDVDVPPKREIKVQSTLIMLDDKGHLNEFALKKASDEILVQLYNNKYGSDVYVDESSNVSDINRGLVKFALNGMDRRADGRLEFPLLWNGKCAHMLGKNYNLAKAVLESNRRRYSRKEGHLKAMDKSIKEQEDAGIIERISNLDQYMQEHPTCSFIAHMPVFKWQKETTKCRIVFLSNISETIKGSMSINHNQAMFSGPSLNQKISTALIHLRFGSKLLCFDIKKAFNQIALAEVDQQRLLFLWYTNVSKNDFSLVGYKCARLPFGLKCSPTILMLSLFRILILDSDNDSPNLREAKRLIFHLFYMDNGGFTCSSSEKLSWLYDQLKDIFGPYQMELQQIYTNDETLQGRIDPEGTDDIVNLLGISWNRNKDMIFTRDIKLNEQAKSKREILRSIASNYDIFNIHGPMLNRARVFMHRLQCEKSLSWDKVLSNDKLDEWKKIAKQANSFPVVPIPRCVGERDDSYNLVAYVDASKLFVGVVVYILNLRTGIKTFLLAKNKIISSSMQSKTIPSLELLAIELGVETLNDIKNELCGSLSVMSINVSKFELFSDSFVALSWLQSYSQKFDKLQKRSVFVMNRLNKIVNMCDKISVTFSFISGCDNPGDCITRCLSHKVLLKSNYFAGPSEVTSVSMECRDDLVRFTVPNTNLTQNVSLLAECQVDSLRDVVQLVPLNRFSSLKKLTKVHARVLECFDKWKLAAGIKVVLSDNYYAKAWNRIVVTEQRLYFPDVVNYFDSKCKLMRKVPNLISQLNVYPDNCEVLRVKSKFDERRLVSKQHCPILLPRKSELTSLLIWERHKQMGHSGCYALLADLRQFYWIPKFFSSVKKVIKDCVICKRFNKRTIRLNQSPYREERLCPSDKPFGYVYLDYCGPFSVKMHGEKSKVWLLCVTCMFTRAVNIKVCTDMTVAEFMRALSLHSFEYGVPVYCVSDLGTQIVAGSNVITDFLKDPDTAQYFAENGVQSVKFSQYFKGCSELGALVECVVKMTKHMIYKCIKTNVLLVRDFEYLVCQVIHLINRRPIAFKEVLRDELADVPSAITPEELIHGFHLLSLNIIPDLHPDGDDEDLSVTFSPVNKVKSTFEKLKKVRGNLLEIYHREFLTTLAVQATDVKDRYRQVSHEPVEVGDLVLIRELHCKPVNYPMGVIKAINRNINDEVTSVEVLKGRTKEITKRHISNIIPLLRKESEESNDDVPDGLSTSSRTPSNRKAAEVSRLKTQRILSS